MWKSLLSNFSHGYAKWRDPQRPASILTKMCKEYALDGPFFNNGTCSVNGKQWTAPPVIIDEKGILFLGIKYVIRTVTIVKRVVC